jgi:hypothetical protein
MNHAKPLFIAVALASLTLTACTSATGEVEEPVGTVQQASLTLNSLTLNSLTLNSLTLNSLTLNSLTLNSLTLNGLQNEPLVDEALTSPTSREVFAFVVGCALPDGEDIKVTNSAGNFLFKGQLGLAPEWGEPHGSCGALCQQWVSACVLSRVDFTGKTEVISVRGENPGLNVSPNEVKKFTQREATYYGDIFSAPQRLFACLSPGKTEDPRVCGPSIEGCGVDVLGSCAEFCAPPTPDGAFPTCRGPKANDGLPFFGAEDIYPGSITVFLNP